MAAIHVANQPLFAANQLLFVMLAIHVLLAAVVVCCTSFSTSTTMQIAVAMQLPFAANQLQLPFAANQLQFAAILVLLATAT